MNVLDLKGPKTASGGCGGETWKSGEFPLNQGIVVAKIIHRGEGDFKLKFVSNRSKARRTLGKVADPLGILGALDSWEWNTAEAKGPLETCAIVRVNKRGDKKIPPRQYHLEVESAGDWHCRFIQPDLGQALSGLAETEIDGDGETGASVTGPYISGDSPVLANVRHKGIGDFSAFAYSLDGQHQCAIYKEQGQFYVRDIRTEIRPGKEYILLIDSEGEWNITFSEGY